jgi:hypothetical protein
MGPRRLLLVAALAALTSVGGATVASAHTLVDPTTLTPPLKPFRVCYEDGPWVKCDTSDPAESYANQEITEFGLTCGTIFESATVTTHATRWYRNLLLVERDAQAHVDGSWSLSPTGSGGAGRFHLPSTSAGTRRSWSPATSRAIPRSITAASFASRRSGLGSTRAGSACAMAPSAGTSTRSRTRPRRGSATF